LTPQQLATRIDASAAPGRRFMAGVAGPPGAGKSTLAAALVGELERLRPGRVALVPMDGFHFDNAVLEPRGWLPRKGAPHTFDAAGFAECLARIRAGTEDVAVPVFDRAADLARAGAAIVAADCEIVVVEGNYLLLDEAPWTDARACLDLTIFLNVPEQVLLDRLVQRWLDHGLDPQAARTRAEANDIPNARLVLARSAKADIVVAGS